MPTSRLLSVRHSPFESKLPSLHQEPGTTSRTLGKNADINSGLPTDPFLYPVPNSEEVVRFYNYGVALPRTYVINAIVIATRAILAHESLDTPIPDKIIRYGYGDVFILLHHSGQMTWKVWGTALQGIVDFLERYEYVDMEFDVGKTGLEQFWGTGALGKLQSEEQLDID